MPEGVATEAQRTQSGEQGAIPGRDWGGFRFETLEQDWFGLMLLLVPVRSVFVGSYGKWQARRALAGCLH